MKINSCADNEVTSQFKWISQWEGLVNYEIEIEIMKLVEHVHICRKQLYHHRLCLVPCEKNKSSAQNSTSYSGIIYVP